MGTDPDGTELPDVAAARREAVLSAREILAEAIMAGREDVPERFLITDEIGELLDTVHTREVLPKMFRTS
jgi:stage III sporulation protein SpoIIIAA